MLAWTGALELALQLIIHLSVIVLVWSYMNMSTKLGVASQEFTPVC
jgi:hypothetical protein